MLYLGNAFSIQMLNIDDEMNVNIQPIDRYEVFDIINDNQNFKSVIGHEDIANVVSNDLGIEVDYNREFITLDGKDVLIVAQIEEERLPEGCTKLQDYELNYYKVEVNL